MKKIFGMALCLCVLAALCACGQSQQAPPVEETLPVREEQPRKGIFSDVGQARTLQEYYSRTAIIGRNEWMEGTFTQTESWAREYAALEYSGGMVTVEYNSGYVLPDAMTKDELSGGVALWDVTVQWNDQPTVWETVQVFYFTETTDSGQTQWLSGLLTGEDVLERKPEAYAYLALDTRFASRMQTLPDLSPPEGAQVLELNVMEEAAYPQESQVWMLNESDAIILSRYKEGELLVGNYILTAYNLDTGVIDWELADLTDIWTFDSLEDGVLTLRQFLRQGEGRVLRVWMEEGRPQWGFFDVPLEETLFTVGDSILTWRDGSIWLAEEVLLEGTSEESPESQPEMIRYNFHQALDDHRFLFSRAGWEWIEYYGVYDLETRTFRPLTSQLQDWGYAVLQVSRDGKKAFAGCTIGGYWGLSLVDLETLEQRTISMGCETEEQAVDCVAVNDRLTRVAVVDHRTEDGDIDHIRVHDTATGALLYDWAVPAQLVAGQPTIQLVGESTLVVTLQQWKTDTWWVYRITY